MNINEQIAHSNVATKSSVYGDLFSNNTVWDTINTLDVDDIRTTINELTSTVDNITRKPEVRLDTTTKLDIKDKKIYVNRYKDGFQKSSTYLIPDITDIKVYPNTVVVIFADKTKTAAVLDAEDAFNLEQGISICITKRLLGEDGSAIYNKLIKRAFKIKKQNDQAVEKANKAAEAEKERREIARIRHEKKQLRKREKEIETYKEAIVRAAKCLDIKSTKKFFRKFKKTIDNTDNM